MRQSSRDKARCRREGDWWDLPSRRRLASSLEPCPIARASPSREGGCLPEMPWDRPWDSQWEGHGRAMGRQWEGNGNATGRPWGGHGEAMGRLGEPHGKARGRPWGGHGEAMGRMWTGRENPWEGDGKDSGILREGHPRRTLPSKSPHPSQNLHIAFPPPKRPPAFQPIPVASPNCLLPAREGYGKAKLKLAIRQCSRDEARRRRKANPTNRPPAGTLPYRSSFASLILPHPSFLIPPAWPPRCLAYPPRRQPFLPRGNTLAALLPRAHE